jgi:TIR domain
MAIRVFVSHSTSKMPDHGAFRCALCDRLRGEKDLAVFVDENDVTAGAHWRDLVFGELDDCNAAVILVNEAALCSEWVDTEAKILCWRAWVEKKDFRVIFVPFGGITPERIAKHPRWTAIAPGEVQMLPRGDKGLDVADQVAVDSLIEQIVATLRIGADSVGELGASWIVRSLGSFLPAGPAELQHLALRLDLPGGQTVSRRQVAKRLYELGPDALEPFLELRPNAMSVQDLEFLLMLLKTNWIDPRASSAILTFCAPDAQRVFALNAALHYFTPKAYVDQINHSRRAWPVIPVDDSQPSDVIIAQIHGELIENFRRNLLERNFKNPESAPVDDVKKALNQLLSERMSRRHPVFVALSNLSIDSSDLIEKIHEAYPAIRIILCTGRPGLRLLEIDVLEPEVNLQAEQEAWEKYDTALSLIPKG